MITIKRFLSTIWYYFTLIACFAFVMIMLPVLIILEKLVGEEYEDQG